MVTTLLPGSSLNSLPSGFGRFLQRYICLNRFSSEYSDKIVFYTFKGALNHTAIKLYSMVNIERAIKAAPAKRGLEFSLKNETLYLGDSVIVKW
jgi:hypothetical protein